MFRCQHSGVAIPITPEEKSRCRKAARRLELIFREAILKYELTKDNLDAAKRRRPLTFEQAKEYLASFENRLLKEE